MPRPRARSLFELGGQWIAAEPGRAGLYRFWNDAGTGRTRRASLCTENLEDAKLRLAEIVIQGAPKTIDSFLSIILEKYFIEKSDFVRTAKMARHAGKLLLDRWGELVRANEVPEKQKEFVRWALVDQGYAISYVERIFNVLAAALAHSNIVMNVVVAEGAILAKWPEFKPKPKRQIYEPTDEELARLLRAKLPENLRRWVLNSMATAGRPEAVLGIGPAQRKKADGLIDLNPEGRRQNKKYRPTVRELPSQTKWLDAWEKIGLDEFRGRYCGYASVDSLDTALERAKGKKEINIPRLSAYSIRHRATSVLRASRDPRVPGEQVSYQLGHRKAVKDGEASTSRQYGQFGPEYLVDAAAALEAWIKRVMKMASQKPERARKAA